jgi:hypothetical protein
MKQTRFREGELALAKRSQHLAESQRRSVAAKRLSEAITDYIEWRAFAYWARLLLDAEGCVSPATGELLEARCPGFLTGVSLRNEAGVSLWRHLISWIDEHIFGYAKHEGWSHALGYYAARDPRCDQIEKYWLFCQHAWRTRRPPCLPTFGEWRAAAADFHGTTNRRHR